jgi:predicted dehydrogenase
MNEHPIRTAPDGLSRRAFLRKATAAIGTGLLARAASAPAWARAIGANDDVRVAVVGINNKGADHIKQLAKTPGARIVALCDVDPRILGREVAALKARQIDVFATTDIRRVLEREDVDAVVIATGDHWHGLLSVWACQAGKDVYVEKPISRTVWEGRKIIEAAARYGRVVQAGTQRRSDPGVEDAVRYVRAGSLGKVQWIRTVYNEVRPSIGRREPWYPDWLDYDLYCGPMAMAPLERDELHYTWRFMWAAGTGDMANYGIHVLDMARRFGYYEAPPSRVMCAGGRFQNPDVGETPNTLMAVFDYPEAPPLVFEHHGLPAKPGMRYTDAFRGLHMGICVQCEGGYYAGGTGGAVYDNNGRLIKKLPGDGGAGHMENFLSAVRSRRTQDLAAPIATGHASTTICLYANISYRLGQPAALTGVRQALEAVPMARDSLDRIKENLAANNVDVRKQGLTLGPWLRLDRERDGLTGVEGGSETSLERARFLLKETQRPPYAIPEQV